MHSELSTDRKFFLLLYGKFEANKSFRPIAFRRKLPLVSADFRFFTIFVRYGWDPGFETLCFHRKLRKLRNSNFGTARGGFMGLIHVTVALRASQRNRKKYGADFLVDTGATDCLAPASKLKRAGIRRRGRMSYELANGETVEYDFGLAEIEFMGELTSGRVIFGPDDCEPILGVTVLESVGIVVEPATQRLKRLPAIPLKSTRLPPGKPRTPAARSRRHCRTSPR
jgi:clan AA aspartic protease